MNLYYIIVKFIFLVLNMGNTTFIISNKLLKNKYIIKKSFESGIVLYGWEVKGLRKFPPSIKNSFAIIRNHKIILVNSLFFSYTTCYQYQYLFKRDRQLLLMKDEIFYIESFKKFQKHLSLLISKVYWKNNFVKLELILVKNKPF